MERSDLPVGQQSKAVQDLIYERAKDRNQGREPDALHLAYEREMTILRAKLDVEVARVRAQTAEDLRPVVEKAIKDWAVMYPIPANGLARGCEERLAERWSEVATAMVFEARTAREHAGRAFPSSPAALPDVVGTPEPAELWDLVGGPRAGFCCQDAYASAARGENLHTAGCPNRCSKWVRAQRGPVAKYPCALTTGHAGDCWLHPSYRATAEGGGEADLSKDPHSP